MSNDWAITTGDNYINFVWQAVTTTAGFANFRQHPHYITILEHVSEAQGREFFELIRDPIIRDICLESEYADSVGHPRVHDYDGHRISPTTLRYGKVLQDIVDAFPDFHNMHRVVEIGVGYGGQARLISEYIRRKSGKLQMYFMVDLLPVLNLSRLYLDHFALAFQVKYLTKSEISPTESYDLVISNYAFSEFTRPLQTQYLNLALYRSRCGYLTMNSGLHDTRTFIPREDAVAHSAEELLKMLPNSVVLDERPKTGRSNYLLVFGQHKVIEPSSLETIRKTTPT